MTRNIFLSAIAVAFVALALSPALHGPVLSATAYAFFSRICHQDPARSFWIGGVPLAVCARCLGIYAGATVGALVSTQRRTALTALLAAGLLNAADVLTELAGLHGNLMPARFLLGFALGAAICAVLAAPDKKKWVENRGRIGSGAT
jgi:uncharacterized membrane protein